MPSEAHNIAVEDDTPNFIRKPSENSALAIPLLTLLIILNDTPRYAEVIMRFLSFRADRFLPRPMRMSSSPLCQFAVKFESRLIYQRTAELTSSLVGCQLAVVVAAPQRKVLITRGAVVSREHFS